jgi:WD40 repeat protein
MVPGPVTALAFTTGTRLTVAFESETFESLVFDLDAQRVEGSLEGHGGVVTCAAATTRFIATGGWDGTARVWDAQTLGPAGAPMPHGAIVELVSFDDSGEYVLTLDRIHVCRLWRAGTGDLMALYPSDSPIEAAAMDHGRVVLVGEEAQAVTLLFETQAGLH